MYCSIIIRSMYIVVTSVALCMCLSRGVALGLGDWLGHSGRYSPRVGNIFI